LILKFANFKRFGVEGLNAFTSALGKLVEVAAESKVEHIVMGMAHRGRLNSLHCVFEKPAQQIFKEFLEKSEPDTNVTSGDVKYHLGYLNRKQFGENKIYLNMLPNPSHLEAVDPLVYGTTRAIQEYMKDKDRSKAMGVVVHGDAALAGQGIVYESLQLQDLVDYTTGGVIHIVMNNQVGFTTNPWQSRSSFYCTEIAKVIGAPIIHVNADEPDLLDHCMQVAVQYRQKFKKDIFIDIVGYRRFGHN
jgi:2-oxoglutarate dehydrogenase E1 component